jgi:DNA uptake protein ComE-like DNA-binding protein
MSKLKPIFFLGIAGGFVAAVRKRASKEQIQDAAAKASDLADRAKQAAPEPVQQAVDTVVQTVTETVAKAQGDGNGDGDATRRYAAPAEAGSQPPAEAGGAPSDEPQPTQAHSVAAETEDPSLDATRAHDLPADVKMPDVSDDDPAVQEAEAAAAADARAIGRNEDENQP